MIFWYVIAYNSDEDAKVFVFPLKDAVISGERSFFSAFVLRDAGKIGL